jgi:hypothetical protein
MYKLLPTVFHDFEFDIVVDDQGKWDWEVWSGWFHQQKNVMVKARRTERKA